MEIGKHYVKHSITGNYECTVLVKQVGIDHCIVEIILIGKYTGLHVGEIDKVYRSDWHKYISTDKLSDYGLRRSGFKKYLVG